MRIRNDKQANYRAVFTNSGKTLRFRLDPNLPITAPKTTELEDIGLNTLCKAGCSYCYTSAIKNGKNFDNIIGKAREVWGDMDVSDRPFQVAIGGSGEPTLHPNFIEFVSYLRELEIIPNYTTNGMHLSTDILEATENICGGVALSFHPHIEPTFHKAIEKLRQLDTKLNVHIIIGSEQSLIDLKRLYKQYNDVFDYWVILPYQAAGRAKELADTEKVWKETFDWISEQENTRQFAFGALFYDYVLDKELPFELNVYEPEIYSGYRMMDDSYKRIRKSSYDLRDKYYEKI